MTSDFIILLSNQPQLNLDITLVVFTPHVPVVFFGLTAILF